MKNLWRWAPVTNRLLADFCDKLSPYQRLFVGFSGGLDSTVLLHSIAQHCNKVIAVHIHHGLSPNAQAWQRHCQTICENWSIPFVSKQITLSTRTNIEEEARNARYKAFAELLQAEDCLLLGHHLNDQAETLLLQLFRGAGLDGLSAMACQRTLGSAQVLRPLLSFSRSHLEDYARFHGLHWIEDESNQDKGFSRNFLRQEIIPALETRWPGLSANLVRTTRHCQEAQSNLDDLALIDCPSLGQPCTVLPLSALSFLNTSRSKNVLRYWLKCNQIKVPGAVFLDKLQQEVILARADGAPKLSLGEYAIRRYQQSLYLVKEAACNVPPTRWTHFPAPLTLEGLGRIEARQSTDGLFLPENAVVEIRFRTGGETLLWHGQTKQLKKLFQEWQVLPWLRDQIPLLYLNNQLAAVVGYAIADPFYRKEHNGYQLSHD
ncbi:MAG: tRNA lysidine(34) synthetase TilS [Tatlockia sp.]|jgi:tRNA(Ile)-lysidine synthase